MGPLEITLIIVGSLLFVFLVFFLAIGWVTFTKSFCRRKNDAHFADNEDPRFKNAPDRQWFWAQNIEEITLKSFDGLSLKGYFLNINSNKLVIMVHGHHGRYYSLVSQAKVFFENGFNVLTINNRTHDTSEGKYLTMGPKESKDLVSWINLMIERNPNFEIVLYGISMGAHIVMDTLGNELPPQVKCVIEDCGFAYLKDILIHTTKKSIGALAPLAVASESIYLRLLCHTSIHDHVKNSLSKSDLPICFIHGDKDPIVPFENMELCYSCVKEGTYKEKNIFEGAKHCEAIKNKEKFEQVVMNFVHRYIK